MEGAPVAQLLSFHKQHSQSQAAVRGQVGGFPGKVRCSLRVHAWDQRAWAVGPSPPPVLAWNSLNPRVPGQAWQ